MLIGEVDCQREGLDGVAEVHLLLGQMAAAEPVGEVAWELRDRRSRSEGLLEVDPGAFAGKARCQLQVLLDQEEHPSCLSRDQQGLEAGPSSTGALQVLA